MNLINKILLPMDFSDSAMNAFHYALNLIESDDKIQLTLLNVIDSDDNPTEIIEVMNQFDTLKSHVPAYVNHLEIIVKHGRLIDTFVETCESLKPKLVVMGTKGKSKSLMHSESNTSQLVFKLDQPVLVVPQCAKSCNIQAVAVAIDHDIDDPSDLSLVHNLARWFNAKVHLLTIDNQSLEELTAVNGQEGLLAYYMETIDYKHVFPRNSDIVNGIENYIGNNNIDVLAILPKTHAKYSPPSKGKLTRILTLQSKIPLLIVD